MNKQMQYKNPFGELEVCAGAPIRTYKDRVFRMIFKDNKEFLELYNAMNDTHYDNPNDLIVTTLENAIYLGMKNDVSFLVYDQLALYEHQSTDTPNMPLRNLIYVANIYSILTRDADLYGTKLVKIPEPKFVVFYNGTIPIPEEKVLKLSDAYFKKSDDISLELKTKVLNINLGYNQELMDKCKRLHEYMVFVNKIRTYRTNMPLSQAVERAINECIKEGILADFLRKNKAEVYNMSIFEYDEEKHMKQIAAASAEQERLDLAEKLVSKGIFSDDELLELTNISLEQLTEIKQQVAPKGITVIPSPIFEYDKEKHMKQIAEQERLDFAERLLNKASFPDNVIMELANITKEQLDELKKQLSS